MHTFTKLKHAFKPLIIFLKVFLNAGQGQVCCEHLRLCTQIFLHAVKNWLFSPYVVPRSAAKTFKLFTTIQDFTYVLFRRCSQMGDWEGGRIPIYKQNEGWGKKKEGGAD